MALVSGGRSSLNPNAPLFIPAAVQQVEDFSPEWWNLVTTATWFKDYWLSQHQGEDIFGDETEGNDVAGLFTDNFDLGIDDEILNMESQFEEFLQSSEPQDYLSSKAAKEIIENVFCSCWHVTSCKLFDNDLERRKGSISIWISFSKNRTVVKTLSLPKERGYISPREAMKNWEKPAKIVSPKCSPRFIQQPR